MRATRVLGGLLAPLVALLVMSAFIPSLSGEFLNWDDGVGLVTNEAYRGLGWTELKWMFANVRLGHYMPLTWLTFGANYVLGEMDPWGYHLFNVLLHGVNTALVLLVAFQLLAGQPGGHPSAAWSGAALAALVFGLHPQRAEAVAWVMGRPTLVSGSFYLLALFGYLRSAAPDQMGSWRGWRVVSVAAFAGAVLAHPLALSLPLTLLLLDVYPLRRAAACWPPLLKEKLPYAMISIGAIGLASLARHQGVLWTPDVSRGLEARLSSVGQSLWFYPAAFLWPLELSPLYELPLRATILSPRLVLPLLGTVATVVILVLARRYVPGGLVAWIHMAIVVAPVSGLFHSGIQLGADRYAYLANLGFAVLAGAGLYHVLILRKNGRLRGRIVAFIAGAVILIVGSLGLSTWTYAGLWQDSETLWRWAVEVDPDCSTCNVNLSEAIVTRAARQGPAAVQARAPEAEIHARKALTLRPDLSDAYFNLGTVLAAQQRYEEAEVALRAYVERAPWDPAGPGRLGLLRLAQGRPADAIPFLRRAVEMDPASTGLRHQLSAILQQQAGHLERIGRHGEAVTLRNEMIRLEAADVQRPNPSP